MMLMTALLLSLPLPLCHLLMVFDSNGLDKDVDENDAFAGGSNAILVSKHITACVRSNGDVDECAVHVIASSIVSFV